MSMHLTTAPDVAARAAGLAELETRFLTTETGERVPYEIGTLFVPENRNRTDSRRIGIGFARIRSSAPAGTLPTFHLPGGPGSSHLGALTPQTDAERMKLRELLTYRAVGDVVIVDQRGYSKRGEVLEFAARLRDQPLDQPASLARTTGAFAEAARAAVAAQEGRDLAGYTVFECADDVNDLRQALGYAQILLVGQSFGSQWSLAVLRRHPGTVVRAMLSGVEPLGCAYDPASLIFAALQRIAFDAERDPALAPYLPEGGLIEAIRAVRARFAQGAIDVAVDGCAVSLGAEDLQQALLRPAEAWPAMILSLYYAHYEDWAREVMALRRKSAGRDPLNHPLIDTSLGVTPFREHMLRTDPVIDYLGRWDFAAYAASAAVWPSQDVGDAFRTPVLDRTPVVFIGGDWDVATPIENMLNLLPYYPNGRAILVHRGPHAARAMLADRKAAVMDAVLDFLRTGRTDDLPVTVSLPAPAFRCPSFPPPRKTQP
jgi:pimeloyl-ACP methyl ester carboxylesterase